MGATTVDTFDSLFNEAVCGVDSAIEALICPQPSAGTILADRYRIGPMIGRGGMGCVYAAEHLLTGKRVAVKWLRGRRDNTAQRLLREARTVGRICHPNVVDIHDAGIVDGHPFIVMELIEGESLEERLRGGRLAVNEAISYLLQVMSGVAAAHSLGIIHRDLKPANILLQRDRESTRITSKVVDFGVSKLLSESDAEPGLTTRGSQVGTPMFMAPEQVRGEALDERADVYALAVTLYHTLSLRYPFEARTQGELYAKILTALPVPISEHRRDLPRALTAVIARGLERERSRRFANVREMACALAAVSGRPEPRSRWLPTVALSALVTLAMAAGWPVNAHAPAELPLAAATPPPAPPSPEPIVTETAPSPPPPARPVRVKRRARVEKPKPKPERLMEW